MRKTESTLNVIWGLLVRIVLVAVLVWIVWKIKSVLITVVLAAMLTYVLLPAVEFLCARRFIPYISRRGQRLIASVLVFAAFFFVVGLGVKILIAPIKIETENFIRSVPEYNARLQESIEDVQDWYTKNVPEDWQEFIGEQDFRDVGSGIGKQLGSVIKSTVEWLGNILEIVLIPVLAFYFVLDSRWLKREFIALLPPWHVRDALRIMREVGGILQSYVIGQLILCIIAGILTWIVLHVSGMNYALMLAVFAGVTRAIPVIGPVVSGVPICLLGLLQSPMLGLYLMIFVIVMHFVESKFIMPILIGDRMKLHPAVVLIVLLMGAELFGILGMFLAAPIAAIAREMIYFYVIQPRRSKQLKKTKGNGELASAVVRSERIN